MALFFHTSCPRSMSVPPKILNSTLPKFDTKDPSHYWGLAFPLNSDVLQPKDVATNQSEAFSQVTSSQPMPLQLSLVYTNSLYQHDHGQCLVCYKNQVKSHYTFIQCLSLHLKMQFLGNCKAQVQLPQFGSANIDLNKFPRG